MNLMPIRELHRALLHEQQRLFQDHFSTVITSKLKANHVCLMFGTILSRRPDQCVTRLLGNSATGGLDFRVARTRTTPTEVAVGSNGSDQVALCDLRTQGWPAILFSARGHGPGTLFKLRPRFCSGTQSGLGHQVRPPAHLHGSMSVLPPCSCLQVLFPTFLAMRKSPRALRCNEPSQCTSRIPQRGRDVLHMQLADAASLRRPLGFRKKRKL